MPTPEEIENAVASVEIHEDCPRCGKTAWTGATEFVSLRLSTDAGGENSSDSLPAVALICQGCGFISLHSPMVLGLV
jgi:hypothetical protein